MRLFYKIYARIFYCFSCATKDPLGFLIFSHTFLLWGVYLILYSLFFLTSSMRHPNSFFIFYHVKKRFDCMMFFRQE